MVSRRHAGCTEGTHRAQVTHSARLEAGQETPEAFFGGQEKGNRRRDCEPASCRFYHGVFLPRVAGKPSPRNEENKTWRMCIDYTCLNKACPKDPFALPRIDQVIDSTAGCELLSFLDATAGYHRIKLAVEDQIKTAFITPSGAYCYITMPFGLKNGGATYQRTIQRCTHSQLGRNLHVYVD